MAGAAARPRSSGLLPMVLGIVLIPAVLGSSQTIFNDGDVSWHIATGRWILSHGAIPDFDPFSFTWAGKPWVPIEWLSEVIYAAAYNFRSYSGVAAVVTAALIALHAIVYLPARQSVKAALLAVIMMDFVLVPMMLARPHLLSWPLLAGWTWLMMWARDRDRAPPLAAALLMALWANLHGSFVFGLAIAAAFGLEALISSEERSRALRQWLLFGIGCALAVCINGNGLRGTLHPLQFTHLQMLPLIAEWKPSSPSVTPFFFGILAITVVLILWKRPRLHPVRWLLLAALLVAALFQVRHQAMLAIVAAMVLPRGFNRGQAVAGSAIPAPLLAGVAAALVLVRAALPLPPPNNEANPWKLIAAVPSQLRVQPVINNYSMGGPLILSGIRPYVDGRGDMYGDALVVDYAKIMSGDRARFNAAVARWNLRWAIIGKENPKFAAMLAGMPEWRRIRADDVGAIYVRTGGGD